MQAKKEVTKEKRKKNEKTLKDNKLETLKEAYVVLHDIARLVPFHQRELLKGQKKAEGQCINISANASNNISANASNNISANASNNISANASNNISANASNNISANVSIELKQDTQETDTVENIKPKEIKTSSKNVCKKKNAKKCKTVKSQLNNKSLRSNKITQELKESENTSENCQNGEMPQTDAVAQRSELTDVAQKSELTNDNNESSSKEKDISNASECYTPKTVVPAKIKKCNRKPTAKKKTSSQDIQDFSKSDITCGTNTGSFKVGSDNTDSVDMETLTFIDCNSKIQKISSMSIIDAQCDNLHPLDFANTKDCRIKRRQPRRRPIKAGSLNVINANFENNISVNKTHENRRTDIKFEESYSSDNLLTNDKTETQQDELDIRIKSNNETLSLSINTTVQTNNLDTDIKKRTIQSATGSPENNSDKNISKSSSIISSSISSTIFDATEVLSKSPEINKDKCATISHKLPKITQDQVLPKDIVVKFIKENRPDVSLPSSSEHAVPKQAKYNNSDKNIEQASHINKTFKSISSKEREGHISLDISEQNDIFKISDHTMNNNNSILKNKNMLVNKLYHNKIVDNGNSKSLNCRRKYIAEENDTDLNLFEHNNKRRRLNRTSWLQNNAPTTSVTWQKLNNSQNINTTSIETNVTCNMGNHGDIPRCKRLQETDLRECLNRKKLKNISTSETASANNNNTKDKKINLNDMNGIVTTTNTTVECTEICDKSLFKKPSNFNGTLLKKEDNIQVNPFNTQKKTIEDINSNDDDDDDCISLFAESLDISQCEDFPFEKKEKERKKEEKQKEENEKKQEKEKEERKEEPHSGPSYEMSDKSLDKCISQNIQEFNKHYAEYMEDEIEELKEPKEKKEFNIQKQTLHTDNISVATTKLASSMSENTDNLLKETKRVPKTQQEQTSHVNNMSIIATDPLPFRTRNIDTCFEEINKTYFNGYCFAMLRDYMCRRQRCLHKHNLLTLIQMICSQDFNMISKIIKCALSRYFNFVSEEVYLRSLTKLNIDQILAIYKIFLYHFLMRKKVIHGIIKELLRREISLKMILNELVESVPVETPHMFRIILECIEMYIKPGEYWDTVKTLVLILTPDKDIIEKILHDCINNKISNIQDINTTLINKLPSNAILILNRSLIFARFKSLLETHAKDTCPVTTVQDFGESIIVTETIASPDSKQASPVGSPRECNITSRIDANPIKDRVETDVTSNIPYRLQAIDLPESNLAAARSFYKDHQSLWKFYVDLDRFIKGLEHKDYDYIIEILDNYTGKQDEDTIFVRSCSSILRAEIKCSEYHLANVIRRTVQTGTSGILGKILFDISVDILASLVDKEAWGLALWFIPMLNMIHDSSYNAGFILLLAEIYLANKKIIKAFELLKRKNIICTSRAKWFVNSTINDEYIRNKIMYILMDALCNDFIEYAFFLFQFLLRDQSSQYYPIDLSRYVDKLLNSILSQNDLNLIVEIGYLILKYNFIPNIITTRALISTLIHVDMNLAKQLYNYAEAVGIYAATTVRLWPVTQIIINTDLTEEEIYLAFLQLLHKLTISFGHTIEFIKPNQISVYLILETKSTNGQFYFADLQNFYNNQTVANIKKLIRAILKQRFNPPILLTTRSKVNNTNHSKSSQNEFTVEKPNIALVLTHD